MNLIGGYSARLLSQQPGGHAVMPEYKVRGQYRRLRDIVRLVRSGTTTFLRTRSHGIVHKANY